MHTTLMKFSLVIDSDDPLNVIEPLDNIAIFPEDLTLYECFLGQIQGVARWLI